MITELSDVHLEDVSAVETDSIKVSNRPIIKDFLQHIPFEPESCDTENVETATSLEQKKVEKSVGSLFDEFLKRAIFDPEEPVLNRKAHIKYLSTSLKSLPTFYECLDASRPWLCYWLVHSLVLLKHSLGEEDSIQIASFLGRCQNTDGGFGGGPRQISHLAPTYAAVNTICSLGLPQTYQIINRDALKKFLWSVKQPDGSFSMHVGGEVDIRGVYCAVSVARLANVYTDDLFTNSAEWIVRCQTYEGGFGGVPGMEAHGGYAFCAIAALSLLRKDHLCDIKSLLRWTVNRQMRFEGGFQGRTNKLVDGCYSFWQGGAFPIIQRIICLQGDAEDTGPDCWLFHGTALQQYILVCCQDPTGGLLDKPSKPRDIYHSCYTLSGLAVAQNQPVRPNVLGHSENLLEPVHPLYNIGLCKIKPATEYFINLPVPR